MSLLRQLGEVASSSLPAAIEDLYASFKREEYKDSADELGKIFVAAATHFTNVYLVLDALDERDASRHRTRFQRFLTDLKQDTSTRILVTSRGRGRDTDQAFKDCPHLEISAHEDDLRQYVLQMIEDDPDSEYELDAGFTERLVKEIVLNASGM